MTLMAMIVVFLGLLSLGIIKREYSDIIMGERYPSYFLLVNLPGAEIDVNIHPNKKEILFLDKAKVKNVIVKTLEKAFSGKEIIQSTPLNADFKSFVKEDYVDIGSGKQSNVEEVFEKGSSEGFSYSAASSEADFREAINIGSRGHKGLESTFPLYHHALMNVQKPEGKDTTLTATDGIATRFRHLPWIDSARGRLG